MATAVDSVAQIHLADPRPDRCAGCGNSAAAMTPDTRFVDFQMPIDRGTICDAGSMAVMESIDQLVLCEGCVKSASRVIGFRQDVHVRQNLENSRLKIERNNWERDCLEAQARAQRLQDRVRELESGG